MTNPLNYKPILFLAVIATALGCAGQSAESNNDSATQSPADSATDAFADSDSEDSTKERCDIQLIDAHLSKKIGTVGVVTWSTSLTNIRDASIEFGLDTNYGLTAPVDLGEVDYRTLLLGMKENRGPYHFRITVQTQGRVCVSGDFAFDRKTDARPDDVELPTVTTFLPDEVAGGFIITTEFRDNLKAPADYAFIVDGDGDVVWWYQPKNFGDLTNARMSYDGRYMWLVHGNVPNLEGRLGRVRMDGEAWEDLRETYPWIHHDLTILPDETLTYLSYNHNECDDIIEVAPDGTQRVLMNSAEAMSWPIVCHGNAIQYSPFDDTYVISDNNFFVYFKIDREGNILWVLNGNDLNQFDLDGGGATGWTANHNFQMLGANHMLFFNNGVDGSPDDQTPASVREIVLDVTQMTTTEVWQYTSADPIVSRFLGDVQRLPNGNTIIDYSGAAIIHQVNPDGELIQKLEFPQTAIGYMTWRPTLYGPPPR